MFIWNNIVYYYTFDFNIRYSFIIGLIKYHTLYFNLIKLKHLRLHCLKFILESIVVQLASRYFSVCDGSFCFCQTVPMSGYWFNQIIFTNEMESSNEISPLSLSLSLGYSFVFPLSRIGLVHERIWCAKFIRVVFKFNCSSVKFIYTHISFACMKSHGNGMIWISYFRA